MIKTIIKLLVWIMSILCDEGIRKGKRFTGAMIGMYAYAGDYGSRYTDSEGRHGTDDYYAAFDYFRYKA